MVCPRLDTHSSLASYRRYHDPLRWRCQFDTVALQSLHRRGEPASMTTAVPRARQTALGAYRLLLRSVAQTFKGDESTLLAAKKEIRQKFEDSRGMSDEKARSDLIYGEAPQLSLACFTPPSTPSSSFRTTGMTWLPLTRPFSLPPAKPPLSLSLSRRGVRRRRVHQDPRGSGGAQRGGALQDGSLAADGGGPAP